jgi:hypothetical protein
VIPTTKHQRFFVALWIIVWWIAADRLAIESIQLREFVARKRIAICLQCDLLLAIVIIFPMRNKGFRNERIDQ